MQQQASPPNPRGATQRGSLPLLRTTTPILLLLLQLEASVDHRTLRPTLPSLPSAAHARLIQNTQGTTPVGLLATDEEQVHLF